MRPAVVQDARDEDGGDERAQQVLANELRLFHLIFRWTPEGGISWKPDPRRAGIVIEHFQVEQGSSLAHTPGIRDTASPPTSGKRDEDAYACQECNCVHVCCIGPFPSDADSDPRMNPRASCEEATAVLLLSTASHASCRTRR